jgi:Domain of unknown function (DUF4410)
MINSRKIVVLSCILVFFASIPFLAGCVPGKTTVLAPVETPAKFTSAEIIEDKATINVPADVSAQFKTSLSKELFEKGGFTRGDGLKIQYRFIQFNPGSRVARYVVGFGAGKGSMTVEAKFFDQKGNELAKIQSEGEIIAGAFGGSFNLAVQKTAKEIAEYAKRFR